MTCFDSVSVHHQDENTINVLSIHVLLWLIRLTVGQHLQTSTLAPQWQF
jgi:hypothetical protein